jgi:hypothetical protein
MMNDVPTKSTSPYIGVDTCSASATATVTGGRISSVKVTSSSTGYTQANLPNILVLPIGHGASLKPILATDGSIKEITIENGGEGFIPGTVSIIIDSPPRCQPQPSPTSRLGTPYSQLVPPGLLTDSSASPDVATAIEDVTQCNCDCWTV